MRLGGRQVAVWLLRAASGWVRKVTLGGFYGLLDSLLSLFVLVVMCTRFLTGYNILSAAANAGPSRPPLYILSILSLIYIFRIELISYQFERLVRRLAATPLDSPSTVEGEFVLYLRTFRTDRRSSKFQYTNRDDLTAYTEEELICLTMRRAYGEVVALGKPGERLPQVGARRLYASDADWRGWVTDLASRAALVMVQMNEGKHTEWELQYVARNLPRERVVLLVPRVRHQSDFLDKVFSFFATSPSLPGAYEKHITALEGDHRPTDRETAKQTEYFSVICFDAAGVAFHDSVRWVKKRSAETQNLVEALALQTVFRLHNLPSWATLKYGAGAFECCHRHLVKPHSRLHCDRTDEQCSELRARRAWFNLSYGYSAGGIWACCPLCAKERQL